MKLHYRISLVLAGLGVALLLSNGAQGAQGREVQKALPNAQLDARHPATLCGRGLHKQEGYVDLYAPFTPRELRKLEGYRGLDGRLISVQDLQQ